jgi:aerobic-type carbon monoxide dehydrogenase small subunit (CoxS/CutS family)
VKPPASDYVATRTVDEAVSAVQADGGDLRTVEGMGDGRCTGYRNIVTSVREAAKTMRTSKPVA